MCAEGGVAFHFERGAFSTAGWLALNRQYYLLTLARRAGRWLTNCKPDTSFSEIYLCGFYINFVNFNSMFDCQNN